VSQAHKQQIATINYLLFLDNRGRRAVVLLLLLLRTVVVGMRDVET
jgi:hypothetical protein